MDHRREPILAALKLVKLIGGAAMDWKKLLAYISGSIDEELLLRNEYLVTENRVLRA